MNRTPLFSLWAWLILAPPLITVWGGYGSALSTGQRLEGFVSGLIIHAVLGACFWVAGLVERRLADAWRWVWFAGVMIGVALMRPALADELLRSTGLNEPVLPDFWVRAALNLIEITGITLVVHVALDRLRRGADSRRRLAAVIDLTEQQRAATELRHSTLILDFQRQIADPIRRAVHEVDARVGTADVAAQLMRVAQEVVRPLADRTFRMAEGAIEYEYQSPATILTDRVRVLLGPPARIEAATVTVPVVLWLLLQLPMVLLAYDVNLGVLLVLASTGVIALPTWLVRLHPLPPRRWLAVAILAVEYGAIGALGALVLSLPRFGTYVGGFWVYGALMFAIAGTLLAVVRSDRLGYLASEERLVAELTRVKRETNLAHVRLAGTTNLLARRLHGIIQADLVTASLEVKLGRAEPVATLEELRRRVEEVLDAPMTPTGLDGPHDPRHFSAEGIRAAILAADEAWRVALDLESDYDPRLWAWLSDRHDERILLREVLLRGLTNVIRFSRSRAACVRIEVLGDRMRLEVRSSGRIVPRDQRVSGIGDFSTRVSLAELVQEDGEVVYRVVS